MAHPEIQQEFEQRDFEYWNWVNKKIFVIRNGNIIKIKDISKQEKE